MSDINTLNIKGWEEVSDEAKKQLVSKSQIINYTNETLLYLEGEEEIPVFIVLSGNAILSKFSETGEEKILYIRKAGQLGEDDIDYDYRISKEKMAQIIYSVFGYPDRASNQKKRLFKVLRWITA